MQLCCLGSQGHVRGLESNRDGGGGKNREGGAGNRTGGRESLASTKSHVESLTMTMGHENSYFSPSTDICF